MTKERVTSLAQARKMWPAISLSDHWRFIDLTGQKFNRLAVEYYVGKASNRQALWVCSCSCGTFVKTRATSLLQGNAGSCGCINSERVSDRNRKCIKHGVLVAGVTPKDYKCWQSMKDRCTNLDSLAYKHYGARGIMICKSWRNSFEAFLKDMGKAPSPEHSIDRINNDDGYYPGNCRWATMKEQSNNRRTNWYITFEEETLTLAQWAERVGLTSEALRYRLTEWGSVKAALTTPVRHRS